MVELFRLEDSVQRFFIVSTKNYIKGFFKMSLCENLSLGMFLWCSHFFAISEADVLLNSVLRQNTACMVHVKGLEKKLCFWKKLLNCWVFNCTECGECLYQIWQWWIWWRIRMRRSKWYTSGNNSGWTMYLSPFL